MESWGYAPEGGGFLFTDELNLAVDSFVRDRKQLPGWDPEACDIEAVESMDFMDLGLADVSRRSFHYNSPTEMLFGDVGYDSSKPVASPSCMVTSVSYFGEEESGSRHSGSLFESNSQESSLIDLKLGRVGDYPDAGAAKLLQERLVPSTAQHHSQAKRARVVSSFSQTPYCQVYGCNKDLSCSKDYHRRHRVCDVHAKTAKVIVNGIEQRFCQQCSRFHFVTEFDDGKRSCRKRLAGHNERRRKLHLNAFSGKHHKLLLSYHGGVSYHERHGYGNQYQRVKDEVEPVFDPTASVLISDERWFSKSLLQMRESWKEYGGFPSLVEDYKVANYAACNVKGFTVSSSYNHALSLLSDESELSHMMEGSVKQPVRDQGSYVENIVGKPPWLGSLREYPSNGFSSDGKVMHSQESVDQHASGVSPEHASTVDLLQLSSHLQRVEQQRNFIQLQLQN